MTAVHDRKALIAQRLAPLSPSHLDIIDESHLHIGHEGARDGAGHYRVIIVSAQFANLNPLARHRRVYDLLADLIPHPVHALAIVAKAHS